MKTLRSIIAVTIAAVSLIFANPATAGWVKGTFQDVRIYSYCNSSGGFDVKVTFVSSQNCKPYLNLKQGYYTTLQSEIGSYGTSHSVVFRNVPHGGEMYVRISGAGMKTFHSDTFEPGPGS